MKINISDIIKTDGSLLELQLNEKIEDLEGVVDGFVFDDPINFKGRLINTSGMIKLDGHLHTQYSTKCYRCLKDITGEIDITVKEDFLDSEKNTDSETYTYEGNYLTLDRVLKDNIVLNLPMKEACSGECKGLCPKCGTDLNVGPCECKEDDVNPRMEVLKKFFQN